MKEPAPKDELTRDRSEKGGPAEPLSKKLAEPDKPGDRGACESETTTQGSE